MAECKFVKPNGTKCKARFVKKGADYCHSHLKVMEKQTAVVPEKKKRKRTWKVKDSFARDAFDPNKRSKGFTTEFRRAC